MSESTQERLEREARESLVAADLSAKMKQWSSRPPDSGNRRPTVAFWLMLLFLGGAAWWFLGRPQRAGSFPKQEVEQTPPDQPAPVLPSESPAPPSKPMAQEKTPNRYLALARSAYRTPDFSTGIRGESNVTIPALDDARQALAEHRAADALDALERTPAAYAKDAAYLRGHALFLLKKYDRAATEFRSLTGSVRYGEAAEWFAVLSELPRFDSEQAVILPQLKQIAADEGHSFQPEAIALLKALSR